MTVSKRVERMAERLAAADVTVISYHKTFQGAWELSTVVDGCYLFHRQYFGYTKHQATIEFKAELKVRAK